MKLVPTCNCAWHYNPEEQHWHEVFILCSFVVMCDNLIETAAKEPASISHTLPADARSPVKLVIKSRGEEPGDHFAAPPAFFL
jgi:hypothetical protein